MTVKSIVISILFLALCGGLFYVSKQRWGIESNVPEGVKVLNDIEKTGVPDFELKDLEGNLVKLSDFSDKVIILNFWASWCEPCVAEFPTLIKLIKHFKGDMVLIAVSADHTYSDMNNFIKAFDVKDPFIKILWDKEKKVAKSFGTQILPETYVLGHNLKVLRKIVGVDKWFSSEALEFFESIVKSQ